MIDKHKNDFLTIFRCYFCLNKNFPLTYIWLSSFKVEPKNSLWEGCSIKNDQLLISPLGIKKQKSYRHPVHQEYPNFKEKSYLRKIKVDKLLIQIDQNHQHHIFIPHINFGWNSPLNTFIPQISCIQLVAAIHTSKVNDY